MRTKDILKTALKDFDGTLILVSHDRDFLDGLVNKVFEFGNKRVKEHLGDIYSFLAKKKMENLRELERKAINQVSNTVKKSSVRLRHMLSLASLKC